MEGKVGASDETHFGHAASIRAAIFTHDVDLLEIAHRKTQKGERHYGVIFVGMHRLGVGECIRRLSLCADLLSSEEMMNHVEFL